ncbi:FtsX-like permease family protein [Pedobacter antarcticus]|uniref:FtsX-like permease family protein n=1 Tax=Pedobacter antarcticus TaxID=34086 RepID=UPI00292CBA7D|nr:FtsX-like permease family protein [Pedobacter antarcticus]
MAYHWISTWKIKAMFRINLKIAIRNLLKYKVYTFINVAGLAVGMASCILIFIFIKYQLSFDQGYKNEDRIYRIVTDWNYNSFTDYSSGSPLPLANAAKVEVAGIEKIARVIQNGGATIVKDEAGRQTYKAARTVFFADPELFDIIPVTWLSSRPANLLVEPNTVVLSEATAKLFFGGAEQAVGKSFLFWNQMNLKVTGVFKDIPANSSIPLNIVISIESTGQKNNKDWGSVSSGDQVFFLKSPNVSEAALQASLDQFNKIHFTDKNVPGNQKSVLQKLRDIHFSEKYNNFSDTTITRKEIYGLALIGLFLMMTACINFINLATAQSVNRSKEVGVRKVMGSMRRQLVLQFLTETLVITVVALLISCILAELAFPVMQNLFKEKVVFSLFQDPVILVFMLGLVTFVSFLAGFYPAMVMSGFSPALAIKNKVNINAGSLSLRRILLIVQFSITIVLIISTIVIMKQMEYVREKPLGFATEAIAMVDIPGDSLCRTRMNSFKESVKNIRGVEMVSYCMRPPLSSSMNTTNFSLNGIENKDFEVRISSNDEAYYQLFNIPFLAGKVYAKSDTINGYIANESFIRKVGINDPQAALGKIISQNGRVAPIVGVVKDFNDQYLKENISPMIFYQMTRHYGQLAVKIDKQEIRHAMKEIETQWNEYFPNEIYGAKFLDEDINGYYEADQVTGFLFRVFAGIIIFISFIGLFGLISFVATQRTKEIAIRKVLGASTIELVKMLNGSFLIMVFVANIVAWPLAYLFVSNWLAGFAYRMDLSIWPFLLAMCISMVITLITVSIRSYKAAVTNTIDALKYE